MSQTGTSIIVPIPTRRGLITGGILFTRGWPSQGVKLCPKIGVPPFMLHTTEGQVCSKWRVADAVWRGGCHHKGASV